MKTLKNFKKSIKLGALIITTLMFSNVIVAQVSNQQELITIKGIVQGEFGPLNDVSIYLKGSNEGTVSKKDGKFSFPSKLKIGDVLIFSYLGFEKQSITINKSTSFLNIFMKEAPIDVLSAINSNKPYKSKRPKS